MRKKRSISLLLTLAMVCSLGTPVTAQAAEKTQGTTAEEPALQQAELQGFDGQLQFPFDGQGKPNPDVINGGGKGTKDEPYCIIANENHQFTAPSKFWGSNFKNRPDKYLRFENRQNDTVVSSYTMDASLVEQFRFCFVNGFDTKDGQLRIGHAWKGDLSAWMPDFTYRVNVEQLSSALPAEQQLNPGDTVSLIQYGNYIFGAGFKITDYSIDLNKTGNIKSTGEAYTVPYQVDNLVVERDGFITVTNLARGGNYRVEKTASGNTEPETPPTTPEGCTAHKVKSGGYLYLNLTTGEITGCTDDLWKVAQGDIPATVGENVPVTAIAAGAFRNHAELKQFFLPAAIVTIGSGAFDGCDQLASFQVEEGNTAFEMLDKALVRKADKVLLRYFADGDYTMPDGITAIGENAFRNVTLENLFLPAGVTSIGSGAFADPEGKASVKIIWYGGTEAQWKNVTGSQSVTGVNVHYDATQIPEAPEFQINVLPGEDSIKLTWTVTEHGAAPTGFKLTVDRNAPIELGGDVREYTLTDLVNGKNYSLTLEMTSDYGNVSQRLGSFTTDHWDPTKPYKYIDQDHLKGTNPSQTYLMFDPKTGAITQAGYYVTEANIPAEIHGVPVTSIAPRAFSGKTIKKLEIPASVTKIEPLSIYNNKNLESITVAGGTAYQVRNGALLTGDGKQLMVCPAAYVFGENAYQIPDGVESIWSQAFTDCAGMKKVEFPASLTSMGENAFLRCGLTEVTLPGIAEIPASAFSTCKDLSKVTIPAQVKTIGANAFAGCAIKQVELGSGVTSFSPDSFGNAVENYTVAEGNLTYSAADGVLFSKDGTCLILYPKARDGAKNPLYFVYTLPEQVTSIGPRAFENAAGIRTVVFSSGLKSIGDKAFMGSGLTAVHLPEGLTSLGEWAFRSCRQLTDVTIPNSLEILSPLAFSGCGLKKIELSCKTIGDSAFNGCPSLTEVTLKSGVESIGKHAFQNCNLLTSVTLPDGLKLIDEYAFQNSKGLKGVITVPGSVKTVGAHAFEFDANLTQIKLEEGVESLGMFACRDCDKLEEVFLPASLREIGDRAFYMTATQKTESLKAIHVAAGNPNFESVRGILLQKTPGQGMLVHCPAQVTGEFVIPDYVTTLGSASLVNSHLSKLYIPKTVTQFGETPFNAKGGTFQTAFFYEGSEENWKQITRKGVNTKYEDGLNITYNAAMPEEGGGGSHPSVEKPAAPTEVTAVGDNHTVKLTWAAGDRARSYTIRQDGKAVRTGLTGTSCTISGLNNGQIYSFVVESVNNGGSAAADPVKSVPNSAGPEIGTAPGSGDGNGGGTGGGRDKPTEISNWSLADRTTGVPADLDELWVQYTHCVAQPEAVEQNKTHLSLTCKSSGKKVRTAAYHVPKDMDAFHRQFLFLRILEPLEPDTTYVLTATKGVLSNNGNTSPEDQVFTFTTAGKGGGSVTPNKPDVKEETRTEILPDGTKVETTTRTDGSKTVVETKKDGTVTTTDTNRAGDKSVAVTKPDGSSETNVTMKNGTTSTTTVDKNGRTESQVKVPEKLAQQAAKDHKPVELPIPAVHVTGDPDKAPVIRVDAGKTENVTVSVPVKNATAGTVAVIVHADGTEEIVRKAAADENSLTVPLEKGAAIKVVDNSKTFTDPIPGWSRDAVDFVTARQLFGGTSATEFSPNGPMTRAMLTTVLWRLEGEPAATSGNTFRDVAEGQWYTEAISWAAENKIVNGYDGIFAPDDSVTREQLTAMLYRYAGSPEQGSTKLAFTDAGTISSYAESAMTWAVENGIMGGVGSNMLEPQGTATRAQVAVMLMRFLSK